MASLWIWAMKFELKPGAQYREILQFCVHGWRLIEHDAGEGADGRVIDRYWEVWSPDDDRRICTRKFMEAKNKFQRLAVLETL